MNNQEMKMGDMPEQKKVITEFKKDDVMDRNRYEELVEDLRREPYPRKAEFTFQWKRRGEEGFDEKKDIITAVMKAFEDGTLEFKTETWQASVSPDGKISGNMPPQLIDFLTDSKKNTGDNRRLVSLRDIYDEE